VSSWLVTGSSNSLLEKHITTEIFHKLANHNIIFTTLFTFDPEKIYFTNLLQVV